MRDPQEFPYIVQPYVTVGRGDKAVAVPVGPIEQVSSREEALDRADVWKNIGKSVHMFKIVAVSREDF